MNGGRIGSFSIKLKEQDEFHSQLKWLKKTKLYDGGRMNPEEDRIHPSSIGNMSDASPKGKKEGNYLSEKE